MTQKRTDVSEMETIYVIIVTHFYYGNIGQLKLWIVE